MRSTVLALCAVLLLAGCGGGDDAASTASKPAPGRAACRKVAAPAPKGEQNLSKPTATLAVGSAVNDARHDEPDCLEPAAPPLKLF